MTVIKPFVSKYPVPILYEVVLFGTGSPAIWKVAATANNRVTILACFCLDPIIRARSFD